MAAPLTLPATAPAVADPAIFTFTEGGGGERFSVHASGAISRPATGMGASGRWIFAGVADRGRVIPLPALFDMLADGAGRDALPATCFVRDVDCGTPREHGNALCDLCLVAGLPDNWRQIAESRVSERLAREHAARQRRADERLATAKRGGRTLATVDGIKVRKVAGGFAVIDGDAAAIGLSFSQACEALGAALIERAS